MGCCQATRVEVTRETVSEGELSAALRYRRGQPEPDRRVQHPLSGPGGQVGPHCRRSTTWASLGTGLCHTLSNS